MKTGLRINGGGSLDEIMALDTEEESTPAEESTPINADFLIGDWRTSDGVELSFYSDGSFTMKWGYFPDEAGSWKAEPLTVDTLRIELVGSNVMDIMSAIYGAAQTDYHFEILKNDEDSFYLAQVYGGYTAYTSPCKLLFTRFGTACRVF